jgi:hypothetical protein
MPSTFGDASIDKSAIALTSPRPFAKVDVELSTIAWSACMSHRASRALFTTGPVRNKFNVLNQKLP